MRKKAFIMFMAAMLAAPGLLTGCGDRQESGAQNTPQQEISASAAEQPEQSAPQEEPADTTAQEEPAGTPAESEAPETETPEADAPEEKPQAEVKMYTLVNLTVREKPDKDSKKMGTLPVNTEVKVVEESGEWYQIETESASGYVFAEYLTKDQEKAVAAKEKADAEAKAEEEAKAAAKAKAAEAAKAAAKKAASDKKEEDSEKSEKSSKKTVVSREKFPNCETGEHGVEVITYSDGSVEKKEY